ncbi:MAG: response regulator [Silvanigrellaceae bacterium]
MQQDTLRRLEGCTILVVDDAQDNRLLVSRFLSLAGAQAEVAADAPQGIVLALQKHFDAILMDIQMPGMDGYEAVQRLRGHDCRIPIIALTAHVMRSERERCMSSGFDGYLTKPISRVELMETLFREIKKYRDKQGAAKTDQNVSL